MSISTTYVNIYIYIFRTVNKTYILYSRCSCCFQPIFVSDFLAHTDPFQVDILTVGLPCVDLSSLNASPAQIFGRNDGPPGSTASGFAALKRYVRKRRPKVVLLENSDRMYAKVQQNNCEPAINNLTKFASKEGYLVVDSILNACQFGIPQNRPRCYMVWVLETECRNSQPLTPEIFNQFKCLPLSLQSTCWDSQSTFPVSKREWEGRHGEKWRKGFKDESSKLGEALNG